MTAHITKDELTDIHLQDSYVLGLDEGPSHLRLNMLFALAEPHHDFSPPLQGERHCYRYGRLSFEDALLIAWARKTFRPTTDLDGEIDYGAIDRIQVDHDTYRVEGPWGDVTVRGANLSVLLEQAR
jgi:hypothetical protein